MILGKQLGGSFPSKIGRNVPGVGSQLDLGTQMGFCCGVLPHN